MTARHFTRRKTHHTGPCVQFESQGSYFVTGLPDASRSFTTRKAAQEWLNKRLATLPPQRVPRERPCLCCQELFLSEGAHNRMCDDCRKLEDGPVAMGIMRPRRRGDGAAR
jgi:hypothetical protein